MAKQRSENTKQTVHYLNTLSRQERWRLCQAIGKDIFDSNLTFEQVETLREHIKVVYLTSPDGVDTDIT